MTEIAIVDPSLACLDHMGIALRRAYPTAQTRPFDTLLTAVDASEKRSNDRASQAGEILI